MFDYGFPFPISEEDRKASAPYFYTTAVLALIALAGFAIYEFKYKDEIRKEKNNPQINHTNKLEKIVN